MKNSSLSRHAPARCCSRPCSPAASPAGKDKRDRSRTSSRHVAGEYRSDSGATLYHRAGALAHGRPTNRSTSSATIGQRHLRPAARSRAGADGKKVVMQVALTFTQEGQWRNLRENPELFTALAAERRAARGHLRHQAVRRPQLAELLLRRLASRRSSRACSDSARLTACVCASSQSSTVPYHWMLLLGFSTQ